MEKKSSSTNYKPIIIFIIVIAGFWFFYSGFGEKAPLEDGLYLSYDYGGSEIKVTFTKTNKKQFRATISPGGKEKIVDKKLRTSQGGIFQLELLGPLWIPPGSVKAGGDAHGDNVIEVKSWESWDVGVVKASFGMGGALRGEWYYDKKTGFLVGGNKTTILSKTGQGTNFILKDTNLKDF